MNKIKDKREAAGLTQHRLAEALGVDRSAIAKWETGEALPRADKLPALAKVLSCNVDDLFEKTV